MLSRFFLNTSNKKMLAPHAVDIAVTISSLIASLCFTFAEPFDDIFLLRQVKWCIGQRKYKQKFTTQGSTDRPTERPSEWIRARSLNSYFAFCKIVVKTGKTHHFRLISCRQHWLRISQKSNHSSGEHAYRTKYTVFVCSLIGFHERFA